MCHGHKRLAECVQTSAERGEDAVVVVRIESAVGLGRLPRCSGVLGMRVAFSDTARDLGVVIGHVTAVCRSGYNKLRQI